MGQLRMRLKGLVAVGLTFLIAGCAGYHLGPTGGAVAGEKSIQVKFFANKTLEPRLSDAIAFALRKKLQQDGTFRLSTHGEPDVVVSGTILRFERVGLSYQPQDVITPRDYIARVVAKVSAVEKGSGKTVYDGEIGGQTMIRLGADLSSAERQALPLIAADFARNAASLLTEAKW